jgi:hypothetical protein
MAQIIIDSSNNLIQGDFDNATVNNRTKFKTTTLNGTTNVYAVPNGSSTSAGYSVSNAADPTNASKITIATNGATDTQIISGINGTGTYLPLSFYTNNALAMQIGTNGQMTVAATANPSFSAYRNGSQSALVSGTWTKVLCNAEEWDTNNNYDSTTNYRFTPTVAGYYQINGAISPVAFTGNYLTCNIFKNGTSYKSGSNYSPNAAAAGVTNVSSLVYLNGTSDYVELYVIAQGTPTLNGVDTSNTYFNGAMIRSA